MGTRNAESSEVPVAMDDSAVMAAVGGGGPGVEPSDTSYDDTGHDDTGHDDGEDTGLETPAGDDTGTEQPAGDDGYVPPTREEYEAMQAQIELLSGLTSEQIDAMLGQEPEQAGPAAAPATPYSQEDIAAMLTPKTFAPPQELLDKVLVDGDAGALTQLFGQFEQTMRHNNRIEMNQAILNGLEYAMPVHRAVDTFFQRNPEMLGARELVNKHIWNIRNQNPQANEMQIMRAVERKIAPVIARAKQIAAQKKANPARANLAPAPSGGGQQPPARGRANGNPRQADTAADRLAELRAFAGGNNY